MTRMPHMRVYPSKLSVNSTKNNGQNEHTETLIDCAVYKDGQRLKQKYTIEQALSLVRSQNNGFVWLSLYAPQAEYMRTVAKVFNLDRMLIEDTLDAHQRPKLEQYSGDIVLLVLKTFKHRAENESNVSEDLTNPNEIMILAGSNYIITIEHGDYDELIPVQKDIEKNEQLPLPLDPIGILYAIADYAVDSYLNLAATVEAKVEKTEQKIFSPRSKVSIDQIYKLKRDVLELRRAVVPLAIALQKLTSDEQAIVPETARRYFLDVLEHHAIATEEIASLDEVLNNLIDAALAKVGIQQNTDMRKISAWAGVGSVPTMIAGIYGMNFNNMPELHWKYGYYIALGILAFLSVLLWYRFKKNDWL